MVDSNQKEDEVKNWAKSQLKKGFSIDDIKEALAKKGYQESMMANIFSDLKSEEPETKEESEEDTEEPVEEEAKPKEKHISKKSSSKKKWAYIPIAVLIIIIVVSILRFGLFPLFEDEFVQKEIPEEVLSNPNPTSIMDVAVDSSGNIFIVDEEGKRLMFFDKNLNYVNNLVTTPMVMAPYNLDYHDGQLYLLDRIMRKVIKIDQKTKTAFSYTIPVLSKTLKVTQDNIFLGDDTNNDRVLVLNPDFEVIGTIGPFEDKNKELLGPVDIDVDSSGRIYVASEGNNRIQIYGQDYEHLTSIDSANGLDFYSPSGVAVGPDGKVYITDKNNNRVVILNSEFEFIKEMAGLYLPLHTFIDSENNIYIADQGNIRMLIYNSNYELMKTIEGKQIQDIISFFDPRAVAFDSKGRIYVSDDQNNKIIILDENHNLITELGAQQGQGDVQFNRPRGLAFDSKDNLYVVDRFNNRIQIYSSDLDYISTLGSSKNSDYMFNEPRGIAIDDEDNIYVGDTNNNRVQIFNSSHEYKGTIDSGKGDDYFLERPRNLAFYGQKLLVLCPDGKYIKIFDKNMDYVETISFPFLTDAVRGLAVFNDNAYFMDMGTSTILIYDLIEKKLKKYSPEISGITLERPRGISVDNKGNIYIADEGRSIISILDNDLKLIDSIGSSDVGRQNTTYIR